MSGFPWTATLAPSRVRARLAGRLGRRSRDEDVASPELMQTSERARAVAYEGHCRRGGPAIFLHGVMPRSGTVFVGELLRLHPALDAYPNEMWEVPFLSLTDRVCELQAAFIKEYRHNATRMGAADFLPVFGNAFLDYVSGGGEPRGRLLLKEAGVEHLASFPVMFPYEHLLLLLRDGRDLVHSTLRTWPNRDFADTCRSWAAGARIIRTYYHYYHGREPACWLVKFEDAQKDPEGFVRNACGRFALNVDEYPFERMSDVRLIGSSTTAEQGQVSWSQHETAPKGFQPTGHWLEWPARWKRTFKRLAGAELIATGYVEDDSW